MIQQIDGKTQVSASDLVYCITSALECIAPISGIYYEEEKKEKQSGNEEDEEDNEIETSEILKENFWFSFELCTTKDSSKIFKAISLAMDIQKAVISQGISLIEKKAISLTQHFRYSIIKQDNLKEIKLMQNPFALQKLAFFAMDAYKVE